MRSAEQKLAKAKIPWKDINEKLAVWLIFLEALNCISFLSVSDTIVSKNKINFCEEDVPENIP